MESARTPTPELAVRLRAVARMLGIGIVLGDDPEWRFERGALRVGPAFFAERGHSDDEAAALTLLELWGPVRWAVAEPDRVRRRRTLAASRPSIEPLLAVIDRIQAAGELLGALPGFRGRLESATLRSLPGSGGVIDLTELPRHLQWVSAILGLVLAPRTALALDTEVRAELELLAARGGAEVDALRRIVAPDPERSGMRRLERGLALLQPAYERLLASDRADLGLATAGEQPLGDGDAAEGITGFDAGSGGDEADSASDTAGAEEADGATAAPPEDDRRARAGERRAESEGADLFAAEQAGFLTEVLATPLPATGSVVEGLLDLPEELEATSASGEDSASAGNAGRAAAAAVELADYRARVEQHRDTIERMRETWHRVIADRIAERRAFARRAASDGEVLDTGSLAATVTAVRSGVRRPDAFLPRESRRRPSRETGSTDYVLLIDRSGSMRGRPARSAADAALVLLEGLAGVERDLLAAERASGIDLDLAIRTALIVYDAEATVVKTLAGALDDDSRRRLRAEARAPGGATNDAAALRAAAEQLGVIGVSGAPPAAGGGIARRRIVLLISDGGSNDPAEARAELQRLRSCGVEVSGIGIGDDELVRRYAPNGSRVDDPRRLPEQVLALIESSVPDA